MSQDRPTFLPPPFRTKKIFSYLLQGLLIIAPLAVTIYSIYWIVSSVDSWIPIFREPVRDAAGQIVEWIGMNLDITERRRAEKEARESRAILQAALDSMTDAVFISDAR